MATYEPTGKHGKHAAQPGQKPAAKRFRPAGEAAPARAPRFRSAQNTARPAQAPARPAISSDAPRPISVDPSETGAFSTIGSGQGAVLHDRGSAAEAASAARSNMRRGSGQRMHKSRRPKVESREKDRHVNRPAVIGLCVAAFVLVAVVGFLAVSALNGPSTSADDLDGQPPRVEQTQSETGQGISYDGYTYVCAEDADGAGWSFVRTKGDSEPLVLFTLQGKPVTQVLYNGAFVIPQNLGETWNVVAWHLGDGAEPTELVDASGNPVQGDGSIASAKLDGSSLVLSFDNDSTLTVPLA